MSWPVELDGASWRVIVLVATVLATSHAATRLSPYFALTWFGGGLLFGWRWAGWDAPPEVVLLPALLVYLGAALTKGLVETRPRLAGNHPLHVVVTGVLTAVVALPVVTSCDALGWPLPREATRALLGLDADALGGVTLDSAWLWFVVGTLYYGAYKVLDHVGLSRAPQTVAWLAVVVLLPRGVDAVVAWVG